MFYADNQNVVRYRYRILHWTLRMTLATTGAKPCTVTIHDNVLPSSIDDTLKFLQRLNQTTATTMTTRQQ